MTERIDTVVIGGGQAGLAMSHHLSRRGREHLVLERGRVAERWRSERWDSLHFQFPTWMISLPGLHHDGDDPDAFLHRDQVVAFLERYARVIAPPIRCGVEVLELARNADGSLRLSTSQGELAARNVVLATGPFQRPLVPEQHTALPTTVAQITANRYSNPGALADGGVLVVGSGASGCQIAEDLVEAERRVYLSVGRHRRLPRSYRGRDFCWWGQRMGRFSAVTRGVPEDYLTPLVTGVAGGHDVDLRALAGRGVTLVGRLVGIEGGRCRFADDLERNLAVGDDGYDDFVAAADALTRDPAWAEAVGPAPGTRSGPPAAMAPAPPVLDLRALGITTVIWATGYRVAFDWVRCPVLDADGLPVQERGVTAEPGVYFLGLPFMHQVQSSFLWGVGEDAAFLAEAIDARD